MSSAGPTPADHELATRLHSVAIHLLRRLSREDRALGVSPARLSALSVLVFGGPRTIGQLAAAEHVTPPTMTRLVAAMEREGLVARDADANDGRIVRVKATSEGKRLLLKGRDRRVQVLEAKLRALDDDEKWALKTAVDQLERVLSARAE
jgi:DNA-binding MarR family transcriptional regulator